MDWFESSNHKPRNAGISLEAYPRMNRRNMGFSPVGSVPDAGQPANLFYR